MAAGLLLAALTPAPAVANADVEQPAPRLCTNITDNQIAIPESPRIHVEQVAGRTVLVLVPDDYDATTRRYPVVYLAQGGGATVDCFLRATDLIAFTAHQPLERQAIVVMPDGGPAPFWVDWRRGTPYESILRDSVIPQIDARYRTVAARSHRAFGGFSGGGGGAISFVARNPDLFAAAASFSGTVDLDPDEADDIGVVSAATLAESSSDSFAMYGDPLTDAVWWHDVNPADLARNLASTHVWFASGDQTPCDAEDVETAVVLAPFSALEDYVHRQADALHAALTAAAVPHTYDDYGCGIHSYRYVERDIHAWWARVFDALGAPPPEAFDHRRATPSFEVWGWSFRADPRRAVEFLDARDVSQEGLRLTGSGTETVTTARLFRPYERVSLDGALEREVRAGVDGRLTFHVDLGPAHLHQQFTAAARLAGQDRPGYFKTRRVSFLRSR